MDDDVLWGKATEAFGDVPPSRFRFCPIAVERGDGVLLRLAMQRTAAFVLMIAGMSACTALAAGEDATTQASKNTLKEAAPTPLRALLITGHNNHNWQFTSRVHQEAMEGSGRFIVTITEEPSATLVDAAKLAQYDLFVLDYNDFGAAKRWGDAAEKNFADEVSKGKGVLAIHSANNAFVGWKDYESMLGLMWRDGAAHGKFHNFDVMWTDAEHPITKLMGPLKGQPDELYHGLTNPQNTKYTLLAQAMSAKETGGTGKNEPMALVNTFGKGRIFATSLGHVWNGEQGTKQSVLNPGFQSLICRAGEWAATGAVTLPTEWTDTRAHNTLSGEQQAAGWRLLFDGSKSTMRGFKKTGWPSEGWAIEGSGATGIIRHVAGKGGGDIATAEEYSNFEFSVDWMVSAGANSGIIYLADEGYNYPWETGFEMQILDNEKHQDGKNPKTSAGGLYDLLGPSADVVRPAGYWNTAVVRVTEGDGKAGKRIEHYLNGVKVVDVVVGGDEYKAAYVKSKWTGMKNFATKTKGHITLQDHGDDVKFRNIMVREVK